MQSEDTSLGETSDENDQGASREAQPVDTEEPPRLPFAVVGIGASAGGLEAVSEFLSTVRADSGMAYIFLQHLPPTGESMLPDILSRRVSIPVHAIEDQMSVEQNHLYCARPGRTLIIKDGRFHLGLELTRPMGNRPVDDLFKSLAEEQRERAVGIILSGMGSNGTAGAQAINAVGGLCIAQEPETAQYPSMPRHLIDAGYADYILRPADIPDVLLAYAGHPYAKGEREEPAALAVRDQQYLREILAVLRTRTRQDFNGYKKPTVLRRVQRRMGLSRITKLGDYPKFLRQHPVEVSALSDDLLIHVIGFFRDPEAWEMLRKQVIVPLVAAREADTSIRCWVTACSSGEEAYTLAMLLVEECERTNKMLDIKVFATDMADRTLQNARAGLYPGGIEAEIEPARLERFFQKEDAIYRVRQELRERVVFAPQNLLNDPPFSRLDIATCRNLLIYLEPPMQQRILGLLHFGLREGGTLFLGTSETAGTEDLFQVVDKKARIYRRIGPTRHSSVEFPLPHRLMPTEQLDPVSGETRVAAPRASIAQLTARALLEQHTPAAVTIDRDYRIVYFHGNVDAYITSPRGEPTRNLMELAREDIRGTVRAAVHRAISGNNSVTMLDGWREHEDGPRTRLQISASPMERGKASDLLVVSFHELIDPIHEERKSDPAAAVADNTDELRRIRDELQSTIEELQTSNEELKASHEEVVSTNEELQSTNEELETSREEMQSLNEELSTVNSQLHAKMEEHQASSNDLASLLSSTDIAVLFLDPMMRIRRFTAAMRRLMDLISADAGRPINNMARKFEDADLLSDAQSVLENLVPIEKEIIAEDGRCYLRRVLPYRTIDNRIDGVVLTFLEITERKRNEIILRDSRIWLMGQKEALQAAIDGAPLAESLGVLARVVVEQAGEGSQCGFYLVDRQKGELYRVAGVSDAFAECVNGFKIGPDTAGCGLAVHTSEPVITADALNSKRWEPWRWLAEKFGFRGVWSFPVESTGGKVVGTFALYFPTVREPTPRDYEFAAVMGRAAGIIISHSQEADERKRAEVALHATQEALARAKRHSDAALLAAEMATFWWDLHNDRLTGDKNFAALVGQPLDEINTVPLSEFLKLIHPQDLPGVQSAMNNSLTDNAQFSVEFRLFSSKSAMAASENGDQTRVQGEKIDVSTEETRILENKTRVNTDERRVNADKRHVNADERRLHSGQSSAGTVKTIGYPDARHNTQRAVTANAATSSNGDADANGGYRWFVSRGTVYHAKAGQPATWVGALVDITERKQAEEMLHGDEEMHIQKRLVAEESNRMKDDFLATLSHELRTPLSSILLWTQLLRQKPEAKTFSNELDSILHSAQAQKTLIEDLLDMSRIISGTLRLRMKEIDLATSIRQSITEVSQSAKAKRIRLQVDLEKGLGRVQADPDRIGQVVWNLLNNAIKFTPEGGRIDLAARRPDGYVEIIVKDTGIGIAKEFLPLIFERFQQADPLNPRTVGGLGLGLAIVKQLVELHAGTVEVQSDGVNRGTTFTIKLPFEKLPDPQAIGSDDSLSTGNGDEALHGAMVLLIEDDKETRNALTAVLTQTQMRVIAVENAEAALVAAKQSNPDLIISDIGLPGMDGYALIQSIRQLEVEQGLAPTPALALTAFAGDSNHHKAIDEGFQMHLSKPIQTEEILGVLRKLISK